MRYFFVIFLAGALAVFTYSGVAQSAGQAFRHCEHAQNTTDILGCVKIRHDKAQEKLNTVFEKVLGQQPADQEENLSTLRAAQKDWIVYRNQQCSWETQQVETESLKRIQELDCLAELTEQRTGVLSSSLKQEENAEAETEGLEKYSAFPRWMNVVARENPDVFWRYGDHMRVDLDCDGQDE